MMQYTTLCLFLVSGKTFTFKDVQVDSDNEFAINFSYNAMSDGVGKFATFYKSQLAGISRTP